MMEDQLKYTAKEAEKEKALKEVAKVIIKEKSIAMKAVEEKAKELERARALVEKKATELETKLGKMEVRLVRTASIISVRDKEVVDLKATQEESEDKFYDMGFANAENPY